MSKYESFPLPILPCTVHFFFLSWRDSDELQIFKEADLKQALSGKQRGLFSRKRLSDGVFLNSDEITSGLNILNFSWVS